MDDFDQWQAAAFKQELRDARRLAAQGAMSIAQALHATLVLSAGHAGLPALLAERADLRAATLARAQQRADQRANIERQRRARHDGAATPWRAWFDGSAHPNPGQCGIGAVLEGPNGARVEIAEPAGYGSSSEAEYAALLAVLAAAVRMQARTLTVYGDSRVVIDDASGVAKPAPSLSDQRARAQALLAQLGNVVLRWIPREKNGIADQLSQRAVAAATVLAALPPDSDSAL